MALKAGDVVDQLQWLLTPAGILAFYEAVIAVAGEKLNAQ